MPCFIKTSLIYRLITSLFNKIKAYYSLSRLKNVIDFISSCFRESKTTSVIKAYINKKPYFLNSYTYKLISGLAGLVDKLLGFINKLFSPLLGGSLIIKEIKTIDSFPLTEKLRILAVFIAAVEFGYCFGSFIKGTLADVSFGYILIPVIFCFVLLSAKGIFNAFKNSFIYKCVKFFFD